VPPLLALLGILIDLVLGYILYAWKKPHLTPHEKKKKNKNLHMIQWNTLAKVSDSRSQKQED
jgi:hypothetical protein